MGTRGFLMPQPLRGKHDKLSKFKITGQIGLAFYPGNGQQVMPLGLIGSLPRMKDEVVAYVIFCSNVGDNMLLWLW